VSGADGCPEGPEALDPALDPTVALPPSKALLADLAAPRWLIRGERIALEPKEDVKGRKGLVTSGCRAFSLKPEMRREGPGLGRGGLEDALRRERVIAIESRWDHQRR
jgi:hypothetical protein